MSTPTKNRATWPDPMRPEAFHGIAGEFVRLVEPHTEADPVALLVAFLAAAGSAIGAGPHVEISGTCHPAKLWPVLVGDTSTGRKGTTMAPVKAVMEMADPSWKARHASHVASGEVIPWSVRDQTTAPGKNGQEDITDHGVDDKRLFVDEAEFASLLRVAKRDGSVLSPILRSAWDSDRLIHTAKQNPAKCMSGAHVVVLGHITPDELRHELRAVDVSNGFANRFLFVMSKRSKYLPRGGELPAAAMWALADRLAVFLDYARSRTSVTHAESFWDVYEPWYRQTQNAPPGVVGSVLGRSAPYVRRLSLLLALLDGVDVVTDQHARAALAIWDYCAASVFHLFGPMSGDRVRDVISTALGENPDGLTRTEVRDLFKRHQPTGAIGAALDALRDAGLAEMEMVSTNGRPIERWRATKATKATEGAYVALVAYVARELDDEWMRWAGAEAEIFMAEEEVG